MAKKKKKKTTPSAEKPRRTTLHEVLAGRKAAPHRPDKDKKAAQKLRRELEEQQ